MITCSTSTISFRSSTCLNLFLCLLLYFARSTSTASVDYNWVIYRGTSEDDTLVVTKRYTRYEWTVVPEDNGKCPESIVLVYDQVMEPVTCEHVLRTRYTANSSFPAGEVAVGYIPARASIYDPIDEFTKVALLDNTSPPLQRFNKANTGDGAFKLAIKLENACGSFQVFFENGFVFTESVCPAITDTFAIFQKQCKDDTNPALVGRCVDNARSSSDEPKRWCTSSSVVVDSMCACNEGYYSSEDNCLPCRASSYKNQHSNDDYCPPCPDNSVSNEGSKFCHCKEGFFRDKFDEDLTGSCVKVNKPALKIIDAYTWVTVVVEPFDTFGERESYTVEVYPQNHPEMATVKRITAGNKELFTGLNSDSIYKVRVCTDTELDVRPNDSDYICSTESFVTKQDVSFNELDMSYMENVITIHWTQLSPLLDSAFSYQIEIRDEGNNVVFTSNLHKSSKEYTYTVIGNSNIYTASLTLMYDGLHVQTEKHMVNVQSKISERSNKSLQEKMSTFLVAVVGFILLILFIVFILAVMWLKGRHDSVYTPAPYGHKNPYPFNTYDMDPASMYTIDYSYSNASGIPPPPRFQEPKTLLHSNPSCNVFDILTELGKDILDYNSIEDPNGKNNPELTLLNGRFRISQQHSVKNKRGSYEADLKFADVTSPLDAEMMRQVLVEEALTLSQLTHNHVLQLHGVLTFGDDFGGVGLGGLVLECSGSRTLRDYCSEASEVQGILWQLKHVADGLYHLHELGFVHKVLSASNIFVNHQDVCRIAGFETRALIDRVPFDEKLMNDSSAHFAPETLNGLAVDGRLQFNHLTDIWSFGVIIWECFSPKRTPAEAYCATSWRQVYEKVCLKEQRLVPTADDVMPPQMATLMMECFSLPLERRPEAFHISQFISSLIFSKNDIEMCNYDTAGVGALHVMLQQEGLMCYYQLFEMRNLVTLKDVDWTDTFLKEVGVKDKKHRSKLINAYNSHLAKFCKSYNFSKV